MPIISLNSAETDAIEQFAAACTPAYTVDYEGASKEGIASILHRPEDASFSWSFWIERASPDCIAVEGSCEELPEDDFEGSFGTIAEALAAIGDFPSHSDPTLTPDDYRVSIAWPGVEVVWARQVCVLAGVTDAEMIECPFGGLKVSMAGIRKLAAANTDPQARQRLLNFADATEKETRNMARTYARRYQTALSG